MFKFQTKMIEMLESGCSQHSDSRKRKHGSILNSACYNKGGTDIFRFPIPNAEVSQFKSRW